MDMMLQGTNGLGKICLIGCKKKREAARKAEQAKKDAASTLSLQSQQEALVQNLNTTKSTVATAEQAVDKRKKILLYGGIALVVVIGGALILKGKKGLKGLSLGYLDTAKSVKGKKKQRAAVFAKLDDQGKSFPKNKDGVRTKPRKKKSKKGKG